MDKSIQIIESLIDYIKTTHAKHADGCKATCNIQYIGYRASEFEGNKWVCSFGGYCLGNLPRQTNIEAETLEALDKRVREVIHKSITDDEYQFESDK